MIQILIVLGYLLVSCAANVLIAWVMAKRITTQGSIWYQADRAWAIYLSTIGGFLWPVALFLAPFVLCGFWAVNKFTPKAGG